jgi:hypothetical protein
MGSKIGDATVENHIGLPEKHLALLWEDLSLLKTVHSDLPMMAMQYAIDGAHPEVLDRLAASKECGSSLFLLPCMKGYLGQLRGKERLSRTNFFAEPPRVDPSFYMRLAEIYFAASKSTRRPEMILRLGMPDWLAILLGEVTGTSG